MSTSEKFLEYIDHTFLNISIQRSNSVKGDNEFGISYKLTIAHLKRENEIQYFLRTMTVQDDQQLKFNIVLAAKYKILDEAKINKEILVKYGKEFVIPSFQALTSQLLVTLFASMDITVSKKLPLVESIEILPEDVSYSVRDSIIE